VPFLERAFQQDTEAPVLEAIARALTDLGAAVALEERAQLQPPPDARELWLIASNRSSAGPIRVVVAAKGRHGRALRANIDTAVGRDAYSVSLPRRSPPARVRIISRGAHVLFR
jgi:hypothetical protein